MSSPAMKSAPPEVQGQKPVVQQTAVVAPKKPSSIRRLILGAVVLVALGLALKYGYHWLTIGRFMISTDDAYVKADTSILSSRISGVVLETPVANNTVVKAGDVVLRLDAKDYDLALATAKAKIATQQAAVAVFAKQKAAQATQIASAEAQVQSALATERYAAATQRRTSQLVKTDVGSLQSIDDANRAREVADAGVTQAQASLDAAKAQVEVLSANEAQSKGVLAELQAALDKAQSDRNSAEVKAPFDGVIANRAVAPGVYVGPGVNLMALVPVQSSFVIANFKETQLRDIHQGAKVEITVDAFKGETYEGKVASLSPSSGAEFSLLPPDNATGNFTKITQRFPVKILVAPEVSAKLRPGMSVAVDIDSRDKGEK